MSEKKNVLILSSSPRRHGNSDRLCDVSCGGVWHIGEIEGRPALQEAYEMGKRV